MVNLREDGKSDTVFRDFSSMSKHCLTTKDGFWNEKNSNVGSNYGDRWEVVYQKRCDIDIHHKVKATLELFRETLWKFQQENKARPRIERGCSYTIASNVLKRNGKWLNTNKCLGSVPGVEIGDEFQSKAELRIVGLHHRRFCGIDYLVQKGVTLATCVVVTNRYANKMESSDVLVYIGEGGNPHVKNNGKLKDQKLERGNLALKNSVDHKTPVRVISCHQRKGAKCVYVYEGLYLAESYWQGRGEFGKLVFKFKLKKVSGQENISKRVTSVVSKSIFFGNEGGSAIHHKHAQDSKRAPCLGSKRKASGGCDCANGCSELDDCSCKVKNGGKLSYDHDGCLVRKRPLIYECGPSCKCSISCINRVSQRGTRAKLEKFKNKFSRYGIRSKSYISKGSFVCKYVARVGFLGKEKEDETKEAMMDVSRDPNVGRFINNSSSPNLYGQKIIISREDGPHMMLFAMRNISPSEELTIGFKNQVLNSCK